MRLDAQSPLVWRQINGMIKDRLGSQSNVYLYRGLHHAIFETLIGLHLRYTHKRKLVVQSGFGDHLTQAEIELAKMGVRFKEQFEKNIESEEKSCLAYVHDLDDALTGELYDHIETLKSIASTKLTRIHLAHHLFHIKKSFVQNLSEFDIIIASLSRNYALVFTGEKVVLPTLISSQMPWSLQEDGLAMLQLLDRKTNLYQSEITEFERALPTGVKKWFPTQSARRIYDRAVVTLDGYDASAMLDLLNKELELERGELGCFNKIETPSLCRWQNESWFNQAEKMGRSKEDLQAALMIDGSLLSSAFSEVFRSCFSNLKELSE